MSWLFDSPIGPIHIVQLVNGMYYIRIDNDLYGAYETAVAAANDVYTFTTGCYQWDCHDGDVEFMCLVPSDIHDWTFIF